MTHLYQIELDNINKRTIRIIDEDSVRKGMAGAALNYNVTPWCSVAQGAIQQHQTLPLLTIDHNCTFFDKN